MKTLKSFEFKSKGRFGTTSKYNWNELLDGQVHELTKGVDYDVDEKLLKHMAYSQARKRGKTVQCEVANSGFVLQATEASDEQKKIWKDADAKKKTKAESNGTPVESTPPVTAHSPVAPATAPVDVAKTSAPKPAPKAAKK